MSHTNPDLFWSRVDVQGPDDCWVWGFGTEPRWGYGRVRWEKVMWSAHRLAYTLAVGPIPTDRWVLHSCDVRLCCNPAHLSLGTVAENVAEMMAKGRYKAVGESFRRELSAKRKAALRQAYYEARFWDKVDKRGPDECWEWQAHRDQKGYGRVGVAPSKSDRSYRVSYRLAYGEIPDGMCVMHVCDNPPCVNPAHLALGTKSENSHDMHRKGRSKRGKTPNGSRHHAAKLTEDRVREIRVAHAAGEQGKTLAGRFGVTQGVVSQVVSRKAWAHVV